MNKVCSKAASWIFVLMLIVPGSVLTAEDPPSAQDQAVQQAQSIAAMPVPPALHQALASSLSKATSIGAKAIPTPPTGSWGIVSEGDGGGGIFRDSDSEAEAWLGSSGYGVQGFGASGGGYFHATMAGTGYGIRAGGNGAGGYFEDLDGMGWALVASGDRGIEAHGPDAGGFFNDSDGTAYALVGHGDWGIEAHGNVAGGYFKDKDGGTGVAYLGHADYGIEAHGSATGGYFADSDGTGQAYLGYSDYGVRAGGNGAGGYFEDFDGNGWALVASGDRGIEAHGPDAGGFFNDSDGTGHAYLGYGDWGVRAYGASGGGRFEDTDGRSVSNVAAHDVGISAIGDRMGGYFEDQTSSAFAQVAYGVYGIYATGDQTGALFVDYDESGFAYMGYGDRGIEAVGNGAGGHFEDQDEGTYSNVAISTYSIHGNGTKAFVQNHPYDSSSVIVYAAPEGDEVATYTRGTARLVDGEATVPLGETFKWVTNPDLGLTAHLTPRGKPIPLAVVDLSTEALTVRAPNDAPEGLVFDYIVYGLRIGFEESSIVQEKEQESYIPSMADHRRLYERRPDLKMHNSLERFKGMHYAINPKAKLDLSRSQALRDAIIEFDPAVHELPGPPRPEEMTREDAYEGNEGHREGVQGEERIRADRTDHDRRLAPGNSSLNATIPMDDDGNVYATSFRPSSQDLASLVDVSEEVNPGDVLVIDRDNPGMMRKAFEAHDTGVIGVVALDAGVVEGTQPPATEMIVEGAVPSHRAAVGLAGVVICNVDAAYGAVWPGDLLVTSPTPGHAMRSDVPLPGTTLGKALEPLEEGVGTIKVMVMLR